jgi:hypothetical protein
LIVVEQYFVPFGYIPPSRRVVTSSSLPLPFPSSPNQVREALTCFIDLHGLPRRTSLKDWAPFCSDPDHAAALMSMSGKTPVGKAKFTSEVESQHKSLVELLTQDFASCKVWACGLRSWS